MRSFGVSKYMAVWKRLISKVIYHHLGEGAGKGPTVYSPQAVSLAILV